MSLRDHLQTIYDSHGRLTPEIVVDVARHKDHPLHAHIFHLPPKQAAEEWYRHRAHELIRTVTVKYRSDDGEGDKRVRAFHSVRKESGYCFEPVEKLATDPMMREMVLRDMERDWRAMQSRYGHLEEFIELLRGAQFGEPIAA